MDDKSLSFFNGAKIRRVWDEEKQKWYFSVVDVVGVLTESPSPRKYWLKIKQREFLDLQLSPIWRRFKLLAEDRKIRFTDCADVESLLRIIQSIPSPKAEPFKRWLAKVGYERLQEVSDPERVLNRSRDYWRRLGRSEKWIQQRLIGQEVRNKLTDYWKDHEVTKPDEFALLSNIIHKEWTDLTINEHKQLKNLKQENLRDHMSDAELVFTALAELSTKQIAESIEATGLEENKEPAKKGGKIAKDARLKLEAESKKSVINGQNFLGKSSNERLG